MKIKYILFILSAFLMQPLLADNHALLIGIGDYNFNDTGWPRIAGNNDVELLESKLHRKDFKVISLKDNRATKKIIMKSINDLIREVKVDDKVYIHFSGHGQLIRDLNGDEISGFDQSFICFDAPYSPRFKMKGKNYYGQNHLIDDELFPLLNSLKKKVGSKGEITVVFDTCFSGDAERNENNDDINPDSEVLWTDITRGTNDKFEITPMVKKYLDSFVRPGNFSSEGGSLIIISACESNARNYQCKEKHSGKEYGSLSYVVSKLFDNNLPMNQWTDFFNSGKFQEMNIFRPRQKPVVHFYK